MNTQRALHLSVLSSHLATQGITTRAHSAPGLAPPGATPAGEQALTHASLEELVAVCSATRREGESLRDSARLLWRSLARMGLTPRGDLLDKIEDEDVVGIYTTDYRQIFRNLNFFRYCSCTLEELVSLPVSRLVRYAPGAFEGVENMMQEFKAGRLTETLAPALGPRLAEEIVGAERLRIEIRNRFFSPVYRDGKPFALAVVNRCRIVGRGDDARGD